MNDLFAPPTANEIELRYKTREKELDQHFNLFQLGDRVIITAHEKRIYGIITKKKYYFITWNRREPIVEVFIEYTGKHHWYIVSAVEKIK